MEKALKIIVKTLSSIVVAAVVLLAILLAGVRLFGLTPYTVLSGSMEPTYHVGSLIYVKAVDPADLKVGDPVTFRLSGGTLATHRIIKVIDEGTPSLSFQTQGDANYTPDGVFPASAIVGKPVFTIPYLGYASSYVQTPAGMLCVVGCSAAVLLASFVVDALLGKRKVDEPAATENANNG